ncbi:MAG: hypothetical protein JOZ17_00025 [Acetobacteraceae bacterium]|nr:hypothetical protein [Acetobacteraceae bacterium]
MADWRASSREGPSTPDEFVDEVFSYQLGGDLIDVRQMPAAAVSRYGQRQFGHESSGICRGHIVGHRGIVA